MRRAVLVLCAAVLGIGAGASLPACTYFECNTIDHPLTAGTYRMDGRADYSLVVDTGEAVETYVEGADAVRVEYDRGPDEAIH